MINFTGLIIVFDAYIQEKKKTTIGFSSIWDSSV